MDWSCGSSAWDSDAASRWELLLDGCQAALIGAPPDTATFDSIEEALESWRRPIGEWGDVHDSQAKVGKTQLTPPVVQEEWKTVKDHVWCARQSAIREGVFNDDWVTRELLALGEDDARRDWLKDHRAWASRCVRWYHQLRRSKAGARVHAGGVRRTSPGSQSVRVPVALAGTLLDNALIAWFEVEVSPRLESEKTPRLFRDPQDRLRPRPLDSFMTSLENAWSAATTLSGVSGYDAFWRLECEQNVRSVDGPSAGGAAARAFWYALTKKRPDPGVVVVAEVNERGELSKVEESALNVKMQAVAAWLAAFEKKRLPESTEPPDTVVVVGDTRIAQASLDLALAGREGRVAVRGL